MNTIRIVLIFTLAEVIVSSGCEDDIKKVKKIFNNRALENKVKNANFVCDDAKHLVFMNLDSKTPPIAYNVAGELAVGLGSLNKPDPDDVRLKSLGTLPTLTPKEDDKCKKEILEEIDAAFDDYFTGFDVTTNNIKNCYFLSNKVYFDMIAQYDGDEQIVSSVYHNVVAEGDPKYFSFVGDFDIFDFIFGNDCPDQDYAAILDEIASFDEDKVLVAILGGPVDKAPGQLLKCHQHEHGKLFVVFYPLANGTVELYGDYRNEVTRKNGKKSRAGDWLGHIIVRYSPGDDYRLIL